MGGANSHRMIKTVKEGVIVENWESKISQHKLPTSESVVKPLNPVRADKLKVAVSRSELVRVIDR